MGNESWPTGRNIVSYSEVSTWASCGYRHKLAFIDKIAIEQNWIHADYGKCLHNSIEKYLKDRAIDIEEFSKNLQDVWKTKNYPDYDTWNKWGITCLNSLPEWMDNQFPNWELIGSELRLEENIPEEDLIKFKGFIDCIVKVPLNQEKTKWKIWIIDWKTSGARGWDRKKRSDPLVLSQLFLYKSYLMQILDLTSREIGTSFVLLKKGAKPGNCIERIVVSSGPKSLEKANKMVKDMIATVRSKRFLKNKYNCKWCPYFDTVHCTK
jgi:hypothetical protein